MTDAQTKPEPLLNEHTVAERLAMSVRTVRDWRGKGYGPRWIKVGRSIRYSSSRLQEWLDSQERGGEDGNA